MKVAVVTPYCDEPLEAIRRAHDSVLAQDHRCVHMLVADGPWRPEISGWDALHMRLPGPHRDYGNTPRGIGAVSALNQGYDAIAFLDADNSYEPDHVSSLVAACQQAGCPIAFSERRVVFPDGDEMPAHTGRDIDTNCFFVTARAAFLLPLWAMVDPVIASVGDRLLYYIMLDRKIRHARTGRRTVIYRSHWADHYRAAGKTPPPDAKNTNWAQLRSSYSRRRQAFRLGFFPPRTAG